MWEDPRWWGRPVTHHPEPDHWHPIGMLPIFIAGHVTAVRRCIRLVGVGSPRGCPEQDMATSDCVACGLCVHAVSRRAAVPTLLALVGRAGARALIAEGAVALDAPGTWACRVDSTELAALGLRDLASCLASEVCEGSSGTRVRETAASRLVHPRDRQFSGEPSLHQTSGRPPASPPCRHPLREHIPHAFLSMPAPSDSPKPSATGFRKGVGSSIGDLRARARSWHCACPRHAVLPARGATQMGPS